MRISFAQKKSGADPPPERPRIKKFINKIGNTDSEKPEKSGGHILLWNVFRPSAQYSYFKRTKKVKQQKICQEQTIKIEYNHILA